jgi:transcriptional regulator with XRE-family HTH domain
MTELRASDMVADKIRELRKQRGWSARQLAEHCELSQDVIQNIENGRPGPDGRRRRAVTVDELMAIAAGLDTAAIVLLPHPYDFLSPEARQRWDGWEQWVTIRARAAIIEKLQWQIEQELGDSLEKIPNDAAIVVERDGKLVPVEEPPLPPGV